MSGSGAGDEGIGRDWRVMRRSLYITGLILAGLIFAGPVRGVEGGREYGAEIIGETTRFEILADGGAECTVSRKLTVYNSEGNQYAVLFIDESPYSSLKNFTAKVFNAEGKELNKFKKGDGHRICGYSSFALYQDVCYNAYLLGAQTYPYTIEYEYKLKLKSLFFWPEWTPQLPIPVKQSRYIVTAPSDFVFLTRATGEIPEATISEEKGRKIYEYNLTDIKPLADEDYVYAYGESARSLKFASRHYQLGEYGFDGGSWSSLSAGCRAMWQGSTELNAAQKALVDSIRQGAATQREICDRLHEALAKTCRYVAIEIGIGGWRPTPAAETYDQGYGDCKDLATMYVSMLRYAGIEAWPVLITIKGQVLTDADFPNLNFNHAILYALVDGDTLWADPTCPFCDMGDLPKSDEDVWVLSLDTSDVGIVRTASSKAQDNCIFRRTEVEVASLRTVSVTCRLGAVGNPYHELMSFLSYGNQDKLEKYLCESDFGLSKKIKPEAVEIENRNESGAPLRVMVRGEMGNAVKTAGPKKYVSFACLSFLRNCEQVSLKDRTLPLDLNYPVSIIDTVSFTIPRKWRVEKLPEAVNLVDEFGSMQVDYSIADDKLIIASRRESRPYYVAQIQFAQFSAYLDKLGAALPDHIAFIVE